MVALSFLTSPPDAARLTGLVSGSGHVVAASGPNPAWFGQPWFYTVAVPGLFAAQNPVFLPGYFQRGLDPAMSPQMANEIRCAVPAGDICGEGAVWHPQQSALYWADINRFLVHRFIPAISSTRTWIFDEPVTSVNLTEDRELLLLVFASRIGLWSPHTHPHVDTIFRLPTAPEMRFNDAGVDPRGSLWAGTMRNNVGPHGEDRDVPFSGGVLLRIDPDGTATEWKRGIGLANTVAWSPDGKRFYSGDTRANTLSQFAFDQASGAISGEQPFLNGYEYGAPDGSAMDAEGFLWNARPGAGCVIGIAPAGRVDQTVPLPVSRPTTCAFGGDDLHTLYITSARSAEQYSGSVFALQTHVPGIPAGRFRLR
jgi:sugar lactone lactonase YvrE